MEFTQLEEVIEDKIEYIWLWETNKHIFDLYKIVRNYQNEFYSLDSTVIVELVKAKNLDMVDCLEKLPYLHSGYVSLITERKEDGRSES